jgi:hypothetical protein
MAMRAELEAGLSFRHMPRDDELLRRALAKTDDELERDLARIVAELRQRCSEDLVDTDRLDARRRELAAAERALERVRRRLGR